jgi:hypothetical protein
MSDQRSFTIHRLRTHPDLFDCTTKQLSSQEERRQFRELIGYRPTRGDPNKFYYDTTNVPILHKDYEGKYDIAKFFLHESLFIVSLTLLIYHSLNKTRKGTRRHYSWTRHCGGYEGRDSPAQGPVSNRALEFAVHYTRNGSGGRDMGTCSTLAPS